MADAKKSSGEYVFERCTSLLTDDVSYDGWEYNLAEKKSFYIRGVTWFRSNVVRNTGELGQFYPAFEHILEEREAWRASALAWRERFSPRQAVNGLSLTKRQPLKFVKAVQTLMLCEAALITLSERGEIDANLTIGAMYQRMRIEPAVFYIQDFNFDKLAEMKSRRPSVLQDLRSATQQTTETLFSDMALGSTVTKKVADAVKGFVESQFPDIPLGDVDYRFEAKRRAASDVEIVN